MFLIHIFGGYYFSPFLLLVVIIYCDAMFKSKVLSPENENLKVNLEIQHNTEEIKSELHEVKYLILEQNRILTEETHVSDSRNN